MSAKKSCAMYLATAIYRPHWNCLWLSAIFISKIQKHGKTNCSLGAKQRHHCALGHVKTSHDTILCCNNAGNTYRNRGQVTQEGNLRHGCQARNSVEFEALAPRCPRCLVLATNVALNFQSVARNRPVDVSIQFLLFPSRKTEVLVMRSGNIEGLARLFHPWWYPTVSSSLTDWSSVIGES